MTTRTRPSPAPPWRRALAVWRTVTAPRPKHPAFVQDCPFCGARDARFLLDHQLTVYREAVCEHCRTSKRNCDVAAVMLDCARSVEGGSQAPNSVAQVALRDLEPCLQTIDIYCTQSSGSIANALRSLPRVVYSEYWDDVIPGSVYRGVRCENLMELTLGDACFDLVICEDILEHVPDPERAFAEIFRVLRPGGSLVLSVPDHGGHNTQPRATIDAQGTIEHQLPSMWHIDPLRPEGALVFTDFGADLGDRLAPHGFEAECIVGGNWYGPGEETWVTTVADYDRYLRNLAAVGGHLGRVLRYNSRVWKATRPR